MCPTAVFKTAAPLPRSPYTATTYHNEESDLSILRQDHPDLAPIIEAWPNLPEPVERCTLILVDSLDSSSYHREHIRRRLMIKCLIA